jgi:hypothetical protein
MDKKNGQPIGRPDNKTRPNHNSLSGLLALLVSLSAIAAELVLLVMLGVLIWSL